MKRHFNPCREYRAALCATMSGDSPAADRAALEQHLATCAGCQKYRAEIGSLTTILSASRELFANVQPGEATQARWAKNFAAATQSDQSMPGKIFQRLLDLGHGLFQPCRWIWAGMAAVWVVILSLNISQKTPGEIQTAHRPSPEMMRALLAAEGFLPGPNSSEQKRNARTPAPVTPQPRSDQYRNSKPS